MVRPKNGGDPLKKEVMDAAIAGFKSGKVILTAPDGYELFQLSTYQYQLRINRRHFVIQVKEVM